MYFSRKGVTTPVCGITGAQQLGRAGWSELRNLSDTEPPFRLFRDEGRTFLQVGLNWSEISECTAMIQEGNVFFYDSKRSQSFFLFVANE